MKLVFRIALVSAVALIGSGCGGDPPKSGANDAEDPANKKKPAASGQVEFKPEIVNKESQTDPQTKPQTRQGDGQVAPQAGVFNVYVNSVPQGSDAADRRRERDRRRRVYELRERPRRHQRRPIVVEMPESDSDDSSDFDSESDSDEAGVLYVKHHGRRHKIVLPSKNRRY